MNSIQLDKEWAHLEVADKEDISGQPYPTCTMWWNSLPLSEKQRYYEGCQMAERIKHHEWKKGNTSFT